jgi:hypothetical protein
MYRNRLSSIRDHLLPLVMIDSIEPVGTRGIVVRYSTCPSVGLVLSCPAGSPYFCEPSFMYRNGAVGSYDMPGIVDMEGCLAEVYHFYFRFFCIPRLANHGFLRNLQKYRQNMKRSLRTMSLCFLSTSETRYVRQELCM